jgi:hypothetical protein|tara:strand:+ start:173 stop:457 length:285 start_codon:yes stop_codon:yes gene_type:complete
MAKQIGEETKITLDLKTIGLLVVGLSSLIGMWFALQADIEEARNLPAPEIQRIEFQMKDEAIRDAIINTQDDVEEIKEQLNKIDERLFDLQKRN